MKIYILNVDKAFRPQKAPFKYPRHNIGWGGVEQTFYQWIIKHKELLTKDPEQADFHYLPIFWTNYHLINNYGKTGRREIQKQCDRAIMNARKTFTLCQYDDGPMVDLQGSIVFLGSRTTADDLDIPLLCSPHKYKRIRKKYVANFVGRTKTHPIRQELYEIIRKDKKYKYLNRILGTERTFVNVMLKSYACLCPRGYGGSSFRFFEAMQLGVVPIHIGDQDIRPFKDFLPWDKCSFYFKSPRDAIACLDQISLEQLSIMGKRAKKVYDRVFAGNMWCCLLYTSDAADD